MRAPTTSWWWNETPSGPNDRVLGLPTSWKRVGIGALDDGDGVGEHVLVPVDGILLEPQRRQLGQELVGQTRLHEEPETLAGLLDDEEPVELVPDALSGNDLQPPAQGAHRVDQFSVGHERVASDEAGGPQHAKGIVGERLLG